MSNCYAVIMAGGSGTRFWPLSRRARPKQLLPLGGEEPLVAATVRRIADLVPPERVYIVTSERLAVPTAQAVPNIPRENILAEPASRNTAPCVGWAASRIARRDPEGILAVLPADHHIGDEEGYVRVLETAIEGAQHDDMVTVGIKPTRPEIGYGYIEMAEEVAPGVHRTRRFVEKPNRQRAEQFLNAGNFLWNSGMFFFRARVVLEAIRAHLPGLSEVLGRYDAAAQQGNESDVVAATYGGLPSISIDHGIMEKVGQVLVVPGSFGWSDLGSWTTAWELSPQDQEGNAAPVDAVLHEAHGCYVRVEGKKVVALIGVEDLVVVDTEDALLIVPRERGQDVRRVVEELKKRGDPRV